MNLEHGPGQDFGTTCETCGSAYPSLDASRALLNSASIDGISRPLIKTESERLDAELPSDIIPPFIYTKLQRLKVASNLLFSSFLFTHVASWLDARGITHL